MSDPLDLAAEREAELRADALADQARRSGLAGKTVADSAATCRICETPIPDARRQAVPGVQTCIECQTLIERAGLRVFPERNA